MLAATLAASPDGSGTSHRAGRRTAFDFATREMVAFDEYRRPDLVPDDHLSGPALVRDPTSVTVIHSDQRFHLDGFGHIVITTEGDR
jgi:N-methylhydantoinase A